jgi:phosphohistidine phosphatase SixA
MRLWVIRHAEAVRSSQLEDDERPLSALGKDQADRLAQFLRRRAAPELLLSSPLLRARQTVEPIQAAFPSVTLRLLDELAPGGGSRQIIDELKQCSAIECILVGHEPLTSHLVSRLISGDDAFRIRFAPATVALVETTEPIRAGSGVLLECAPPELLATLI